MHSLWLTTSNQGRNSVYKEHPDAFRSNFELKIQFQKISLPVSANNMGLSASYLCLVTIQIFHRAKIPQEQLLIQSDGAEIQSIRAPTNEADVLCVTSTQRYLRPPRLTFEHFNTRTVWNRQSIALWMPSNPQQLRTPCHNLQANTCTGYRPRMQAFTYWQRADNTKRSLIPVLIVFTVLGSSRMSQMRTVPSALLEAR